MILESEDNGSLAAYLTAKAEKERAKPRECNRGMHNGTVYGKGFEESRRNRKSHAQRRADHAAKNRK